MAPVCLQAVYILVVIQIGIMSSFAFIFQAVNHADHWNIELEHKNNDNDNNNDTNKSRILPKSRFLLTGKEIAL